MDANTAYLTQNTPENVHTVEHPLSGGKTLEEILSNIEMTIIEEKEEHLIIDLVGIEAPIANALRRIMLSEVPTMAIEDINLWQNTSVIPDEVLAHRIGLIPIDADPRLFKFKHPNEEHSSENCICFKLHAVCRRLEDGSIVGDKVMSGDLQWQPFPNQQERFGHFKPVHDDIIIAKLGPGQEIEAELFCEKGIGATHTKWSPVCTASYRLAPKITLKKEIAGENAINLKNKCPMGVFDVKKGKAVVKNPRNCTSCRECIREDDSMVSLAKVKDHFIFTIETTGALSPRDIFREAIKELRDKAAFWLDKINIYKRTPKS
ncbi:unnamed protein product [Blepharisma stoltei]|uniref:DNA-directed RNA polymerase RpoA/D/Rpb3-type domain-containing protein n=1 Tax=Blepharisma stoltei TaxID=1481888 RepID=A0AAU9JU61_9CILI|nr:unnamed protein product [Blepharisma stoltei]